VGSVSPATIPWKWRIFQLRELYDSTGDETTVDEVERMAI